MLLTEEKIKAKFADLLSEGRKILAESGWRPRIAAVAAEYTIAYARVRAEGTNLIERVCGPTSTHYRAVRDLAGAELPNETVLPKIPEFLGILEGAANDYRDGFLVNIRHLVRAELLDDFLAQGEALLEHGYAAAAASLTGAVLEDTLRKLCDKNSIPYDPAKSSIEALNMELARADVYNKLVQKKITAEADLRNLADHGKFDQVKRRDVEDMVAWVRHFVEENLN